MSKLFHAIYSIYELLPEKPFRKGFYQLYVWYRRLNKRSSLIATIHGVTYDLDLTQLIDSSIYYKGSFEPETTRQITKSVKQGMVVIDVGANIGCHTFHFAQLVGKKGQVIAFEPMSSAFSKLIRNAELNQFDNITLEKAALGRENGTMEADFRTSWSLYNKDKTVAPESVPVYRLDDYLNNRGINHIDFIKLDVDGYEYKVLQGSKETLEKNMPLIITEFSNWTLKRVGDNSIEFLGYLENLGYLFFGGKGFSNELKVNDLIGLQSEDTTINLLCVARGKML